MRMQGRVWISLEMDGEPLPPDDGPARLLVPGEGGERYHRWIFGIQVITLVAGKRASRPRAEGSR
jgi:DMSO/TMAO reductase YedYZ molybdopterin-dependent catalytic subunit